jgi:hypothetical protein
MECLNSIDIDSPWGMRSFELWHGDVTNLHFVVDLLMISTLGSDFSPLTGTVIGTLSNKLGISVEHLSKEPELDFIQPVGRLWGIQNCSTEPDWPDYVRGDPLWGHQC